MKEEIIKKLLSNASSRNELTKEEIEQLRKDINFYGVVPASKKEYANLSIINWRENYLRKLHVTAIIGYLFAVYSEYDEYDTAELEALGMTRENAVLYCKKQTEKFIRRNFDYNPDKHIRTAYVDPKGDPDRSGKLEKIRKEMNNFADFSDENSEGKGTSRREIDMKDLAQQIGNVLDECKVDGSSEMKNRLFRLFGYFSEDIPFLYNGNTEIIQTCEKIITYLDAIKSGEYDTGDVLTFINKLIMKHQDRLKNIVNNCGYSAVLSGITGSAEWIPPINVFYHLERYINNNYEQLRQVVEALYCEKPDIEYSVQLYKTYRGETAKMDADADRSALEGELIVPVSTIENDAWVLLGPFKENRERIEFYNKNTELIKMMFEQAEKDEKLASELVKDRGMREKKKNIMEAGPDDPGLKNYEKALGTLETLGAKKILSKEEEEEFTKARLTKEMAEVPADSIQSYVWRTDENGNFVKDITYIKAEAPTYLEEPLREQRERESGRVLRGKSGAVKSLEALKQHMKPSGKSG